MKILFTGHRNKHARLEELDRLRAGHANDIWIHGGARGFDNQIERYAKQHRISTKVYRPDYRKHGAYAPFVRNDEMLQDCDMVVALYDGRDRGGTFYTINRARKLGKKVIIIVPSTIGY